MKLTIEIQSQSSIGPDAYKSVEAEIQFQKQRTGALISLSPRISPPGTFASLDPNAVQIILDLAGSSAWPVALKGVVDVVKMLNRPASNVIVKVGDVELQLPPGTSTDDILAATERLVEANKRKVE